MNINEVKFSVAAHASWSPDIKTESAALNAMPALLRRRASPPGKMALEAAYRCLEENNLTDNTPILFCSRHGECERSVNLLMDLVRDNPISPTAFSLSVHNAIVGLFSIARHDHANSLAIAAGHSTIEHAVIEACGLLHDGSPAVLLIAYDDVLPDIFTEFQDCNEQAFAFAWLLQTPQENNFISLSWSNSEERLPENKTREPAGIEIHQFFSHKDSILERICNDQRWQWKHHT